METLPRKWVKDIVTMTYKLEDARMDEDTALKAAGCKALGVRFPRLPQKIYFTIVP